MKYIKLFEKWGISKEVEDSAKYYIQQMLNEPDKDIYNFFYYSDKGDYNFDIIIDKFKDPNQYGVFGYSTNKNSENGTSDYIIQITRRDDITTLIHELKHFDRLLRKGPNNDMLSRATSQMDDLKVSKVVEQIFYYFNTDEYEARYHEYYYSIDKYLYENLKENPTSKDVVSMVDFYLESVSKDKSFKLWKIDINLNILKSSTKKELIKIFNKVLDNKPLFPELNINDIKTTYKSLINFIKSEIGMEVTPKNFDKLVKKLNIQLNKNREKFGKKFNRLYTIMVDKYVK